LSDLYVDWGGTHFRYKIDAGEVVSKPAKNVEIISEIGSILAVNSNIKRVGISFAGQVNNNKILSAPNILVHDLDLNSYFEGVEFVVQNDLKCALLAESQYFKTENIAVLYVGTGIGSAYMSGGRLISGADNLAGEIGHIPYKNTGFVCGCGKDNCLELTASGSGIAKRATAIGIEFVDFDTLLASDGGNKIAIEFVEGVGYAASLIITILNPRVLVLGGGVVAANPYLVDSVKKYVHKNAFAKSATGCEIVLSQLADGSLDGATLLFR
jgi:glucokinase